MWEEHGSMPLIPSVIYVAYRPRVELTVGEAEYGKIKGELQQAVSFMVGGVKFQTTQQLLSMSDEENSADQLFVELLVAQLNTSSNACTVAEYKKQRPDVQGSPMDIMVHYVKYGKAQGMCMPNKPLPMCTYAEYFDQYPGIDRKNTDALKHFFANGYSTTKCTPWLQNDPCKFEEYYKQRPDAYPKDAKEDYDSIGRRSGACYPVLHNTPSCTYNEYLQKRPEVRAAQQDPMQHYIHKGRKEGMCYPEEESEKCNYLQYYAARPDVKSAKKDALDHYNNYGKREGTRTCY